jgi:hypothetical protein
VAAPHREGKIIVYGERGGPRRPPLTAKQDNRFAERGMATEDHPYRAGWLASPSGLDRWLRRSVRLRVVTAAMTHRYVIAPFDAHSNRTIAAV